MSREKSTIKKFEQKKLTKEKQRQVKGGYKWVPGMPGGSGSNGLVDWGELEIREEPPMESTWSGNFGNNR